MIPNYKGPIPATRKVLERANLTLDSIDCFEINEGKKFISLVTISAFSSVVLAWQKELGVGPKKVNPNGGAIAHGHPLGATGAILMTKLVNELERSGSRYGLQVLKLFL
jgi:acetyl-CoA acetyltransferase